MSWQGAKVTPAHDISMPPLRRLEVEADPSISCSGGTVVKARREPLIFFEEVATDMPFSR